MDQLVVSRPAEITEEQRNRDSSVLRMAVAAISVAIAYYLGAKIGFALTFKPHPVSTLWPPNSILLAALLLSRKRWWWLLLLAAFPAHLIVQLNTGVPLPMMLCWFVSNCCEALIGASVITWLAPRPLRFDTSREVGVFIFAAILAPFLSSFLDAGFVVLNQWGSGTYWSLWRLRFFSNVLAELTMVPFIVLWLGGSVRSINKLSGYRLLEAAVLGVGLLMVTILVLGGKIGANPTPALLYAPLPFLLLAALRFGPEGISTSFVAVALLTIWGAIHDVGPFATLSPEENALSVQLFLIGIFIPLLSLAAVIQEHRHLRDVARQNEEQLAIALDAAQMGTWDWRIADNRTRWSDQTKRIFGFSPTDSEIPPEDFYEMLHPDDRALVRNAIARAIKERGPYAAEFRMPQSDGSVRWVRGQGKVLVDQTLEPVRMVGVNTDITTRKRAEEQLRQRNRQIRSLAGRLISAQEFERRRISRELHDDLSQRVAALSIAISRLKRRVPASQQDMVAELDGLYLDIHDLSTHIRQLSHELHPAALEHLGLEKALEAFIAQFERDEEIDIRFTARMDHTQIASDISVCLYRIAVEGLRNIAKHSQAKSASISLEEKGNNLVLEISDQGKGFDIDLARKGTGIGLVSAEERVRLLQGQFEIESDVERGTKLTATVPLR